MHALHSLIITFHNCANSLRLLLNHNFPVLSRAGIGKKGIFSLPSISHLFVLQKGGISSLEFVEEAEMQKPKFAKAAALLPNLKMGFINLDCLGNIVDWFSCHPQERLTCCYGTYIYMGRLYIRTMSHPTENVKANGGDGGNQKFAWPYQANGVELGGREA